LNIDGGKMRDLTVSYGACAFLMAVLLILSGFTPSLAYGDAFTDLPSSHWSYQAVKELVDGGILDGYPDGTFRGKNLVTRYALAVTLARAIQKFDSGTASNNGISGSDWAKLEKLIREFSDELAMLGVKSAAFEERLENQRKDIDQLKLDLAEVKEDKGSKDSERLFLEDGEMRVLGYNKEDIANSAYILLNLGFNVDNKISGKIGLEYNNVFDQDLDNDTFGTYEAYADFTDLGPFDKLRLGKYNELLGTGMTLMDRREGFTLETEKNKIFVQLGYFDAGFIHARTDLPGEGHGGFYYIREDTIDNRTPKHIGLYGEGKITKALSYEAELVDYDHGGTSVGDATKAANRNDKTKAFYVGAKYQVDENGTAFRFGYINQEEDYRALAVDSDLRYRGGKYSVLEDVLQAIRDFTPSWVDPDEINGFTDFKLGADFKVANTGWNGRFDLDMMQDNTSNLDNNDSEFNLVTVAVDKDMGKDTNFQLRYQSLFFDNDDNGSVESLPALVKKNENSLRAQFYVKF
jgi:hypothetical protein